MIKKNVYLVDMGTGSNMNLLPLAIGMIGSYALDQPEIKEHFNIDLRFLREDSRSIASTMKDPVIVGFSCYVWNYRGSLAAAREIKRCFPNATIVLGGYSVPKLPHRIKELFQNHPYIDILIHGEGEEIFANVLRKYIIDKNYHEVQGVTHQTFDMTDGFISNPKATRIANLDDLPSPFLNGVFDDLVKRYGSKITGGLWETNRGCPYYCTFCDWGNSDVNKIKQYSLERLHEEISWMSRKEFYYMFIGDANFGIFAKRDLEIAGYIADLHTKTGFPHHVGTNWAKNKGENVVAIAEKFAESGVFCNVTMAIQSANPDTLKAIKRRNLERGEIDKLKGMFHDRYLPTYVEVILGLPLETYETFSNGLNTVLSNRIEDRFFVYLCQMLENTELSSPESREKYKQETRFCRHTVSNRKFDWEDHNVEYEEFVIATSTLPMSDWVKSYVLGYFLTVMYNHRAAFFPIIFLKEEFDVLPVDVLEFVISQIHSEPDVFPVLCRSIDHIDKQAQLILDGVSTMSGLPEAEELIVLPHVGSVALLAYDKEGFYNELDIILKKFFDERQLEVDPFIFGEVIAYQRLRFQGWPQKQIEHYRFETTIPEYFQNLTNGLAAPKIEKKHIEVTFTDHTRMVDSFAEFAATLVRGGLAVDLLQVDFQSTKTKHNKNDLRKIRLQMEQQDLDKLKLEYEKITV